MIDACLGTDALEEITPGEAVAGMSLNGVGLATPPLSFPPQCLANTPRDRWCREGVRAAMCNRFQLGCTRDTVHTYGGELVLSGMAVAVYAHAGLDWRFHHFDTTRVVLTGASGPHSDEQAMTITHGYSKDHRPDVQGGVSTDGVPRWGWAFGAPTLGWPCRGYTDVPGARRSPDHDLAALVYAAVSGSRRQTGTGGPCRQSPPARREHAHAPYA
jgi:hypothetical protein